MTMKPEQWQAVIDINLSGVFYATKAAASELGLASLPFAYPNAQNLTPLPLPPTNPQA